MADAFVIGGDGVSLFASVGIMMPLASRQEDVSDPLKESDLRDRLMQDLGLSDTADSDEEEWAPDPTIALKLDGFREPLKDSELQDRLMKDLGLSDSDEEEWVPKTKLATLESEEEERHFKSQFDSKDSDEEEWIPSSEGEEEEEWRPKSRVDYKESDEEEWVSGVIQEDRPRNGSRIRWSIQRIRMNLFPLNVSRTMVMIKAAYTKAVARNRS
ncbi:hypothetical protein PF002_g26688 [Phytophthora fragariae]|uniref:Uncharacterized protein n=1 Tax=Phytophthora fragariae TaxID=53985 RepID=A0A6A3R7D9_9STRA|nr:hypothetical protein PF011_g24578 [Phytophthora fragariae]KAE9090960.1 hypothetical protein PF006_g25035 [Phytophthora fragariae]KAE9183496.1 hypothetical protein PF002_g26688 [Phytophthora fragariae]